MSEPENLPDIDAGLAEMSTETTAADLLRQQGQRKKIKVINQKQLKAQIQEWISHAVNEIMANNADRLDDSEREQMIAQAEARVQELMNRNREAEADRQRATQAREEAEGRLHQLAAEHGVNDELKQSIAQLQEQLQKAELVADEAQQDLMVVEQDLDNTKKMFQQTLTEKDRLNDTVRQHMLHTTDLVANVLALDSEYYADKHQQENPVPDDAEGAEAFYHDFAVGTGVIETLSGDLTRLREVTEAGGGQILERDLELIEQLKAGSLDAVDVAAPVENLVEALDGARSEVVAMGQAAGADSANNIAALPDGDGDAAEVLAASTSVVRQLTTALAEERAKVSELSGKSAESDKANQALRENMIRTGDLVQGVLALDNDYYASRHQNDNPVAEDAEGADLFYHDFDVGAQVIQTLSQDLNRLRELTKDQEKFSGLLDSDLALLEQLKEGSLSAVDVAAPVANLVEALSGARGEAVELNREASEALGIPAPGATLSELPDPDEGDPAEVLAHTTQVARELATSLAAERKRLTALKSLADEADELRSSMEAESEASQALADDTLDAISDAASTAGVEAKSQLTDRQVPAEERTTAARESLEQLTAALAQERATVAELTEAIEELLSADETVSAAPAGVADDADKIAAAKELSSKIERLGGAYRDLREAYRRSSARNVALADQLQALARDLHPDFTENDAIAGDIAAVNEAAQAPDDQPDQGRDERLNSALDKLVESMRKRAGEVGEDTASAVNDLARELLSVAKDDDALAGSDATVDLALLMEGDESDGVVSLEAPNDPEAVIVASRKVISEMRTRHGALDDQVRGLESRLEASEAANRQLNEALHAAAQEALDEGADVGLQAAQQQLHQELQITDDDLILTTDDEPITDTDLGGAVEVPSDELELEQPSSTPAATPVSSDSAVEDAQRAARLAAAGAAVVERLRQREKELGQRVSELEGEVEQAQSKADQLESAQAQRQAALEGQRDGLQQELDGVRARIGGLEQECEQGQTRIGELEQELEQSKGRGDELTAQLDQGQGRIGELEQELEQERNRIGQLERELEQSKGRGDELTAQLDQGQGRIGELEQELEQGRQRVSELEQELEHNKGQTGELSNRISELEQELDQGRDRVSDLEREVENGRGELIGVNDQLATQKARLDELESALAAERELLRQANAELEEYRAREATHGGRSDQNVQRLKDELAALRKTRDEQEAKYTDAVEEFESTIAGLRARCEDLDRRIEDRDNQITDLQTQLDKEQSERVETKDGQARIQAIQTELDSERNLRAELQRQLDSYKGGVGEELEAAVARRDELTQRVRELEGDVGEQRGLVESLKAAKDKLKSDHSDQLERLNQELEQERQAREEAELDDDVLHEEIAGLKAKLRALSPEE